jgi:hypothetical protein
MDSCNVNGTADGFTGFEAEVWKIIQKSFLFILWNASRLEKWRALCYLQLFKAVAEELYSSGMTEWSPSNWSFSCILNYSTAWRDIQLQSSQRFCDILLGAVTSHDIAGRRKGFRRHEECSSSKVLWYCPCHHVKGT